ncbi:uncharacterized protein LOC132728184 [Ruditapes philippinarum]|uniref:uncharacterized protein LOC132728184 n=1 Tax=Ruditapes philippinarum TaxID=129788 RepID=UPI00295B0E71|nr:uncharacterized protein LOC132728184 [Ruditapes philippinarum]
MKFSCIQLCLVIVSCEVLSLENKRLLLHDPVSIAEAIHQLRTEIGELNATHYKDVEQLKNEHAKEVADLRAGLNAEKLQRCRTGSVDFNNEKCATHCSESQIIHFSPSFTKVPVITFAFSTIDVNKDHNTRINSSVSSLTTSSAKLTVGTWHVSEVYRATLNWIACPNM